MVDMLRKLESDLGSDSKEGFVHSSGTIPDLSGDLRPLIPKLGLREYWYAAIGAGRVKKHRPLRVRMLGEDLCLFRDNEGSVLALTDYCPHRGARLSEGDCHSAGTVSCPYHGWTFDGGGKNVAVLGEGPDSSICGKPGTEARAYPTRTLKGIVFVWMGAGAPAPIEEDVPEEFFDPKAYILFNDHLYWKTNWEVALENAFDAHVSYLHRDHLAGLLTSPRIGARGAAGGRPILERNGVRTGRETRSGGQVQTGPAQDEYPEIALKWPKHRFRRYWFWIFKPLFSLGGLGASAPYIEPELQGAGHNSGHYLPGWSRPGGPGQDPEAMSGRNLFKRLFWSPSNHLFGRYTRDCVPVEESLTRMWYFHYTRPKNRLQRARLAFMYFTLHRWLGEYNFSQQDMSVMPHQRWDISEALSPTDSEVVLWRKLIVTKHYGGRNAIPPHARIGQEIRLEAAVSPGA